MPIKVCFVFCNSVATQAVIFTNCTCRDALVLLHTDSMLYTIGKNTKKSLHSSWILKYKQHKSTEDRPKDHMVWLLNCCLEWDFFVIVGVRFFVCLFSVGFFKVKQQIILYLRRVQRKAEVRYQV